MAWLKGTLHGTDYSDTYTKGLKPGKCEYTLKARENGRLSMKIRAWFVRKGETKAKWSTIEEKIKIREGEKVSGTFKVPTYYPKGTVFADPKQYPGTDGPSQPETTKVKFKFSRPALGKKSSYHLDYA